MFGLDLFETRLTNISSLRIDHWLRIFIEFEGRFAENFGLVEKLLDESALHCGMTALNGFRFSRR